MGEPAGFTNVKIRASFLEASRAAGPSSSGTTPARVRLHARRVMSSAATSGAAEEVPLGGPSEAGAFVFATPGGASLGQKAGRSGKKKVSTRSHAPETPFEGSPMQWSPLDSQASDQSGSTPGPVSAESRWVHPGSNANIANVAAQPASEGSISVELMTRLHLSGSENLPQELHSRLNLSGQAPMQQPPAAKQPGLTSAGASADAELSSRLRTQLHVSSTDNLMQQFQDKVAVGRDAATSSPAKAGQPAKTASAAPEPGAPGAPAPVGFVFGAGVSRSPAMRQRPASKSPGVRKQQADQAGIARADAGPRPTTFPPPVPAASQGPAPAPFVFGAAQPPSAAAHQSTAEGQRAGAATSQPSQPGLAQQQPPTGASSQGFVFGAASAGQGQQAGFSNSQPTQPPTARAAQQEQAPTGVSCKAFVFGAASAGQAGFSGSHSTQLPTARAPQQQHAPAGASGQAFVFGTAVQQAPGAAAPPSFVFGPQPAAAAAAASAAPPFLFGMGPASQQQQQQAASQEPSQATKQADKGPSAARRFRRRSTSASPSQASPMAAGFGAAVPLNFRGASVCGQSGTSSPAKQKAAPAPPATSEQAQERAASAASEMYRNQGNEAFKNQAYEAALDLYTKAIKSLWPYPALHSRLALLLSNRAAALLSLGKPYQALQDCQMGLKYDPKFSRCALRIATCHYRLGGFAAAEQHLRSMEGPAAGDRALLAEISSKVEEVRGHRLCVLRALRTLGHAVPEDAASRQASSSWQGKEQEMLEAGLAELEALWAHVPHAPYLHAAKAQVLLRLGRFSQAIEACNAAVHHDDAHKPVSREAWQLWVEAQCTYHDGNYSTMITLLQQLLQLRKQAAAAAAAPFGEGMPSSLQGSETNELLAAVVPLPNAEQLADMIRSAEAAQQLRQQGNDLMKLQKYAESVQKYSEALAAPGLSAAFASILHSNRAAAHQGLLQWVQAVADCCRSKALVPAYVKASSRLASLLTELRLYEPAVQALEHALQTPGLPAADRRDYEARLREARHACQKKATPRLMGSGGGTRQPDHYKLLMLEKECTLEEVRKAYKRLALLLHPDKAVSACCYSVRLSEHGVVVLPAVEAQERLQQDAKWLFQCLGHAHEVLSDKAKRQDLDFELRMEERYSSDVYGGFGAGGYGASRYAGGAAGHSPGGRSTGSDFAEKLRRAAQQRQEANRRGYYGYYSGFPGY